MILLKEIRLLGVSMALVINEQNADIYFNYLAPKKNQVSIFSRLFLQIKRFVHLLFYGEYIDEKKIYETLASQKSVVAENPKLAHLLNEASVRLGQAPPINLFEQAKLKAKEGGLSDSIEEYGLKARDLYLLATLVAAYHAEELSANYKKYLITEEVAQRLIEDYHPPVRDAEKASK